MLIATHPPPPGWAIEEGASPHQVRQGGPSYSSKLAPCPIRTTLIIAPSNLLGQWGEEVIKHFKVSLFAALKSNAPSIFPMPASFTPTRPANIILSSYSAVNTSLWDF